MVSKENSKRNLTKRIIRKKVVKRVAGKVGSEENSPQAWRVHQFHTLQPHAARASSLTTHAAHTPPSSSHARTILRHIVYHREIFEKSTEIKYKGRFPEPTWWWPITNKLRNPKKLTNENAALNSTVSTNNKQCIWKILIVPILENSIILIFNYDK